MILIINVIIIAIHLCQALGRIREHVRQVLVVFFFHRIRKRHKTQKHLSIIKTSLFFCDDEFFMTTTKNEDSFETKGGAINKINKYALYIKNI